ncbi:hypothetical protein ABPG77_009769 [Micractinium sp. CCAP 211/92]
MGPAVNLPAATGASEPRTNGDSGVDAPERPRQTAEEAAGFHGQSAALPAGPAGPSELKKQGAANGTAIAVLEDAGLSAAGGGSAGSDALPPSTVAAWAGAYAAAAEADSSGTGVGKPAAAASSGQQKEPQLLRRLSSNSRTPPLSMALLRSLSARRRPDVWGWLRPAAGTKLPFVLLQGKGVALGRGRDAYHERLPQLLLSRGSASGGSGSTGSTSITVGSAGASAAASPFAAAVEADRDSSAFVEVPDGRVSRLHAWVKWDGVRQQAVLEVRRPPSLSARKSECCCDLSSNGTFLNGERVGRGRAVPLADGDRISLVLSVAPLAEQAFIFRTGDPRLHDGEVPPEWAEEARQHSAGLAGMPSLPAGGAERRQHSGLAPAGSIGPPAAPAPAAPAARNLARCVTNQYSSPQTITLDDLQCQICLSVLRDCVALEPCGHNYCAACLSHHLAALLTSGQPLACPLRCAPPERVVVNTTVRQLLSDGGRALLQQLRRQHSHRQSLPLPSGGAGAGRDASLAAAAAAVAADPGGGPGDLEPGASLPMPMHPLCPLHDEMLPLDTASLKSQQLAHGLESLQQAEDEDAAMVHLESLARLAWSDEAAREKLGELRAVQAVLVTMRKHLGSDGVQCNGCLALMALVRGEGPASDANRLAVAEGGGVQVMAEAMCAHLDAPMVQLSALLCLVPLALENTYLQVTVARSCLPGILAAMHAHGGEPEVVGKALIMLGVLGQGEDEAHEVIRQTIIERTPFPATCAAVLRGLGTTNEDVLWSVLFCLAVIARDSSRHYVTHLLTLASAGVLPALERAMAAYRQAVREQGAEPDEMILRAGDYLVSVLRTAHKLLRARRNHRLARLALLAVAALLAVRWARRRAGPRPSAAPARHG